MNNYDEIKMLVEASRRALKGKVNESNSTDIRKQYGLIIEQISDETDNVEIDDINIEEKPKKDSDEVGVKKEKQKAYRVLNNIIILHGKTKADLQLTTD
jgi:hypothetical protein